MCIPSGDHTGIQAALTQEGSEAVLCPNAVFELGDTIFFTQDDQHVYTEGFPTDDSRALLRVVGKDVATAISAEGNNYVSIKNVIIDGNRPALGIADGALINFGRGIEDRYALGHVVEWVRAYEPRGWTIIYLGGPCDGAVARNNDVGPAGRAEYVIADGISVDCRNAVVENNTITDVTDGGVVVFQSPGAVIADNTIRAKNRIMIYGISMEDYWPDAGDFTSTTITRNVIDANGAMIREGIGMGPLVGCADIEEEPLRSRGAIVTDNVLMGNHMGYGYVVGGVENWTVTGNVDLSTHLVPEEEAECFGNVADHPAGFQLDPRTTEGTFQDEFEAAVLGGVFDMWPLQVIADEPCMADLIGADLFSDIRAGSHGDLWVALEEAPNGERIASCVSVYQPPDTAGMPGDIGLQVQDCTPECIGIRIFNLSETETANMQNAEFILDDFSVPCVGLPERIEPLDEFNCTIDSGVTEGFHVLTWYGFPGTGGKWTFTYPFEEEEV